MNSPQNIYPVILIILSIAQLIVHTQALPWYTNRIDGGGYISRGQFGSVVLFVSTIWVFTKLESSTLQIGSCLFGLLGALSFWGIRFYYSEPQNIAEYVAETYIHKKNTRVYD